MKLTATVQTIDGSARLQFAPGMRKLLDSFLQSCKDGQAVTLEIKRLRAKGTYQQCKTIWGLLVMSIKHGLDEMGVDFATLISSDKMPPGLPVPKDVIMQILYATCNDVGDNGERKTLSQMDIVERMRFFDRCRDYAASAWGIIVPDPEPNWREKL